MTAWTDFVTKVMKRDGISYKDALKKASSEYKKGEKKESVPKKGEKRKGAMPGARLAFDDTKQEKMKAKKASKKKAEKEEK